MSKDWTVTSKEHAYMEMRQNQNIKNSMNNPNENWMDEQLKRNSIFKFKRQKRWGFRIFDFWCHYLGIAIEVDGKEHNQTQDKISDQKEFERSRIIVLRVRNGNESDAIKAISYLNLSESWNERRTAAGMKPITQ